MRYYAIADIHGRLDLLKKAFETIRLTHDSDEPYHIITLGDYIDRGPDSKGVLEFLIDEGRGNTVISLQGNHEVMAVTVCLNPHYDHRVWWMGNGGDATLESYGHPKKEFHDQYGMSSMDQEHVGWMATLPLYYETPKQIFVHAGIPFSNAPLEKQDKEKMVWMLYGPQDHGGWFGNQNATPRITKHIVHGHHQHVDGPHEWSHRTDLDTAAYHTGRLVIGVFDDTQGKALRYIEVLGDDYNDGKTYS